MDFTFLSLIILFCFQYLNSLFVYNIISQLLRSHILLCRVECIYKGRSIAFHVDSGSNHEYFATLIEYEEGDGDLNKVEVKEALDSSSWDAMQQSWGAVWKFDKGAQLHAPFSIRLTTLASGKTIVAENVIPAGWKPGQTYRSIVNF